MKYFIDEEFLEGTQDKTILGIKYGKTKPTIDLISIGIVSEDNREYYAISKDFNLKEAWNRWQQRTGEGDRNNTEPRYYWIRENVLKPIFNELLHKDYPDTKIINDKFSYKNFKYLINKYGKTNKQIAEEIVNFVYTEDESQKIAYTQNQWVSRFLSKYNDTPKFYAYYADYDWVAFCWLFGKMMDLPTGFPMYCIDLKQEFDKKEDFYSKLRRTDYQLSILEKAGKTIKTIKDLPNYPKQTNEHNALSDARWNKELHEFLNKL